MLPLAAGREASAGVGASVYERHRPERTLLYQLVEDNYPALKAHLAAQGTTLPGYVEREFEAYLKCGRLEHGFFRLRCETCHAQQLLAFSCKRRGFCPSCGARRMAESAALLVDEVFPEQPVRQWVLSFPYPLRFLFASRPASMGQVLGIVYRCIATHLIKKAGFSCTTARTGAVTLIQRFGSAVNLNVHFHVLFLDGVYVDGANGSGPRFRWVKAPTSAELTQLTHTIAHRVGRFLERQGLLEKARTADVAEDTTPVQRRAAMTWAQRLKRVFNIDIEICKSCGGHVKIIACIEDPVVIEKILTHLDRKDASHAARRLPPSRAPPQAGLFA